MASGFSRTVSVLRRTLISLGSNLGDRRAAISFAAARLSQLLTNFSLSQIIETDPVGEGLERQPRYLNAVATGETTLDAHALLEALLKIERDFGRQRPYQNAPRTLDLDLILLGDEVIDEPGLQLPHPRFRDRLFVLGPAARIAPDLRDPVSGRTLRELQTAYEQTNSKKEPGR